MDENIDERVLNATDNFYKLKTEYEQGRKQRLQVFEQKGEDLRAS